jgi:hypothetical protein
MRRRLTLFVQVAFGLLASHLLLAQHVGLGGSTAPPHLSGQGHVGLGASTAPPQMSGQGRVGLSPSSPTPSRSSSLPSGPMALRPGVRYPSSPVREGQHRPSTGTGRGVDDRNHTPYVYTGYTWLNPVGYGFPVAYGGLPYAGQDDAGGSPQPANYVDQPPADYAPEPPAPQVADNAPPGFRPPYLGEAVNAPVNPQPATILIFKDRRAPVEIHNYALTANTLYALDGDSRQEIPLSLLNLEATVEANRAAGVDFALPSSR